MGLKFPPPLNCCCWNDSKENLERVGSVFLHAESAEYNSKWTTKITEFSLFYYLLIMEGRLCVTANAQLIIVKTVQFYEDKLLLLLPMSLQQRFSFKLTWHNDTVKLRTTAIRHVFHFLHITHLSIYNRSSTNAMGSLPVNASCAVKTQLLKDDNFYIVRDMNSESVWFITALGGLYLEVLQKLSTRVRSGCNITVILP